MAQQSLDYIKSRFETGDRPNGQDFADLIDTLAAQATDLGTAGNNEEVITGLESETVVDSFIASEWRFIKYVVSLSVNALGENKFYSTEFSILIDQNNINISEYGGLDNNGDSGTVVVSQDGTTVKLTVIPNPDYKPVTVRYFRTGLKA